MAYPIKSNLESQLIIPHVHGPLCNWLHSMCYANLWESVRDQATKSVREE